MPRLPAPDAEDGQDRADLRMPVLGAAAWLGGLAALTLPWWAATAALVAGVLFAVRVRRRPWIRAVVAGLLVAAAVGGSALLREAMVADSPVAALAGERAVARMAVTITSDPRAKRGQFSEYVVVRARTQEVLGRGTVHRVGVPVLVIGDPSWRDAELGSTVRLLGRLAPADDHDLAAVISARSDPEVVAGPSLLWRGSAAVRASIRESVAHTPEAPRALVPALVAGDDQDLPEDVVADFQAAGLTHLLAVSGTNQPTTRNQSEPGRWVGVLPGQGHFFPVRTALLAKGVRPTLVGDIGDPASRRPSQACAYHPAGVYQCFGWVFISVSKLSAARPVQTSARPRRSRSPIASNFRPVLAQPPGIGLDLPRVAVDDICG